MNIEELVTRVANDPRLGGFNETPNNQIGQCVYRTKDGHACAIGCLLTEEQLELFAETNLTYEPETNNVVASAEDLHNAIPEIFDEVGLHINQAECLQEFHDSYNAEEWSTTDKRNVVQAMFRLLSKGLVVPYGPNAHGDWANYTSGYLSLGKLAELPGV